MSLQLWEVYFKRLLEACMEHVFKAPHKPPLQAWPRPASDVSLVAVVSVGAFKGPLYSRMRSDSVDLDMSAGAFAKAFGSQARLLPSRCERGSWDSQEGFCRCHENQRLPPGPVSVPRLSGPGRKDCHAITR